MSVSNLSDLMNMVQEVVSASHQCASAQRDGASWDEFSDDRKHYSSITYALEDALRNLLNDRTILEYEATQLMTAMTDVLHHFTKTPSTLADSETRAMGHAARDRMHSVLVEIGAKP